MVFRLRSITVDDKIHFVKHSKFRREVQNLIRCRGSPHIVQLLGKTLDSGLVFEKGTPALYHDFTSVLFMKRALLQLVDGLAFLHSIGIVHRDLVMKNILVGEDRQIIIADLETTWNSYACRAPELWVDRPVHTAASDIYSLGNLIWELTFRNQVRMLSFQYAFPVPPPFADIYYACLSHDPVQRPTLAQLRKMVEAIV